MQVAPMDDLPLPSASNPYARADSEEITMLPHNKIQLYIHGVSNTKSPQQNQTIPMG